METSAFVVERPREEGALRLKLPALRLELLALPFELLALRLELLALRLELAASVLEFRYLLSGVSPMMGLRAAAARQGDGAGPCCMRGLVKPAVG